MARRLAVVVALSSQRLLALDPFELSSTQVASLQAAASILPVPDASMGCKDMDQEPTDVEKDFAMNPYWKYFTYDTFDSRTWVTLNDLESCLKSVPGGDVNPWVGASDLWEANKLIYTRLGATVRPEHWFKQSWFERSPVKNSDTVLGLDPNATAPMSSMSNDAWEQQPCNAFSNAAFFEISIQACKTASMQNFGDFGGTWPWKNEIIAAAALMAYGSFAMHGNPTSGSYHEFSGITSRNDLNANQSTGFDTSMMDRVSMDVLFFVFFQAMVRASARDPTDSAALKSVLGLLKDDRLEPLGCDKMYCDALQSIHMYQQVLAGPTENWHLVDAMRNGIPNYELASVGLVLVAVRAIMSDELFGSAGMSAYTAVCSALVLGLMPNQDEALWAEQNYCQEGTDWYTSMKVVKWRVVKDIAKSLATLVTILESLIEGMFWQETLVGPSGYLDPYLNGVVNVTACWRQTHGNWHRVAAQMMKELMVFITTDVYDTTVTTITEAQKQQAWGSLNLVVAEFMVFINALKTMKAANEVNLCRVFKLAQQVAASGKPLEYQIMPMFDTAGVNEVLTTKLRELDPILDMDLGVNEAVKDPTGACNYKLENVKIDEISGFKLFQLQDLAIAGEYVEGNSFENTMVKFKLGLKTCPLDMKVKVSADFVKDGGKLGFICNRLVWRTVAHLDLNFQISDLIGFAQANFQKLFAGDASALTAGVDLLTLNFEQVQISYFDISNFPGERGLQSLVNGLMRGKVLDKLEEKLSDMVKEKIQDAMDSALAEVGSKLPTAEAEERRRRLQSQTCASNDAQMVDSTAGSRLLPMLGVAMMALSFGM